MNGKDNEKYDLVVIGGGSAAFAASIKAAEADASVLLIERETLGGTCVNRGCVPSKNILHAAELSHSYHTGEGFPGIPVGKKDTDFKAVFEQKAELVTRMRQAKYEDIIAAFPKIKSEKGDAKFLDDSTVDVNGRKVTAGMFLIATGASPTVPLIPGLADVDYMTYRDALSPKKQPKSLIVIGGGPVGLELGQAYSRLGTKVTIVKARPRLASKHEPEISAAIQEYLSGEGMEIYVDSEIKCVAKQNNGIAITFDSSGKERSLEAEALLVATGVTPNTDDLSLSLADIDSDDKKAVLVDKYMRSNKKGIYAAGDVTGGMFLVTTAAQQGGIAVENGLLGMKTAYEGDLVPNAIFTSPQIASVGLTERAAAARGIKTQVSILNFEHVPKAAAIRDTRGLLKLVVDTKKGKIIGVHAVCHSASEVVQTGLFIIKGGMTVGDVIRSTFVYLTMTEAIKLAALALNKDVTKLSCCAS